MKTRSLAKGLVLVTLISISPYAFGAKTKIKAQPSSLKQLTGEPSFKFSLGETQVVVSSAELDQSAEDQKNQMPKLKGPALWLTKGESTTVVDLRTMFSQRFADHVFVGDDGKSAWLFLEWGTEGPASEFVVLTTRDAGQTWERLADLKKPPFKFPFSTLVSLTLDRKGNGKALFKHERTDSPKKVDAEDLYLVTTTNGGRSWIYPKSPWAKNSLSEISRAD